MKIVRVCEKCGSTIEYDVKPVIEGRTEQKDVYCPLCHQFIDTANTDLEEFVRVVRRSLNYVGPDEQDPYR